MAGTALPFYENIFTVQRDIEEVSLDPSNSSPFRIRGTR
jgi:hypothetical protein